MHRISREKHSRGQSFVVNYVHCLVLLSEKKKRTTERLKESDGKPSSFSFVIEDDGNRNVILKCIYSLAFVTTWR